MARRVLSLLPDFTDLELLGLVSRTRPAEELGTDWYAALTEFHAKADILHHGFARRRQGGAERCGP